MVYEIALGGILLLGSLANTRAFAVDKRRRRLLPDLDGLIDEIDAVDAGDYA
jgi:hypothetical protein